jgi:ATP-dependent Lhr-like helicase
MEEEFVFESRVGNVFFLGNNEWRIEAIDHHRITVSPVRAIKPRAPFWKGDILYRDYRTSQLTGRFRRQILSGEISGDLVSQYPIDSRTEQNLLEYIGKQRAHSQYIATDKEIVAEWFKDSGGEPHCILHTCFGARVNSAMAIILASQIENRHGTQVQFSINDDGLIFRLGDVDEFPDIIEGLHHPAAKLQELLINALGDTALFSIRFRYNAARALILERSKPNHRIPLWLQRLRAADLLQIVRDHERFPVLVETYRECLEDFFDLKALLEVISKIQDGSLSVHTVHTPYPSPMAAGLMFNFLSENLYETDRSRYTAGVASVSSELLAEILSQQTIPTVVTQDIVQYCEQRWQHLTPESKITNPEELYSLIQKLAPVSDDDLRKRTGSDLPVWLDELRSTGRIEHLSHKDKRWILTEDRPLFGASAAKTQLTLRIRRYLHSCGPVLPATIAMETGIPEKQVQDILQHLLADKSVVHGELLVAGPAGLWCDRHNFAELYRRAIAERRNNAFAAGRDLHYRFLLRWHGIANSGGALQVADCLKQYAGFRFPPQVFEREILFARSVTDDRNLLSHSISDGSFFCRAFRAGDNKRITVDFIVRGTGNNFAGTPHPVQPHTDAEKVYLFLQQNGSSYVRDISDATGLSNIQIQPALRELSISGLVSCEQYRTFISLLSKSELPGSVPVHTGSRLPGISAGGRRRQRNRASIREDVHSQVELNDTRWFLLSSFAVTGKAITHEQRAERQARLLLQRYGILVKEWYRREAGLLPWYQIFQVLKRLEWQGEIRRGYFIDNLSGVQFALPQAVALLEQLSCENDSDGNALCVSTADPALPFGVSADWDITDATGKRVKIVRAFHNHLIFSRGQPVFYSENYGSRIWFLQTVPEILLDEIITRMKCWLKIPARLRARKRIEINEIDGKPVRWDSTCVEAFTGCGFEWDGRQLILWPSDVI